MGRHTTPTGFTPLDPEETPERSVAELEPLDPYDELDETVLDASVPVDELAATLMPPEALDPIDSDDELGETLVTPDAVQGEVVVPIADVASGVIERERSVNMTEARPLEELVEPAPLADDGLPPPDAARSRDLVGLQVGNYVIKRLLGHGGMGVVYEAEHPEIGRQVAIKVLAAHLLQEPVATKRFITEARTMTRLAHPNIVEIYDFGRLDDGRLYYVMDYLSGCDLETLLHERGGRLTAEEAQPLVEQLCSVLQAAHELGIVHRDLKPDNLFITDRSALTLKVLDFGIAKLLEVPSDQGLTLMGTAVGTPVVIAPEQADAALGEIGAWTDIYALGVITFWVLAGKPPFWHKAPAMLLTMHVKEPPPLLRSIVPEAPAWAEELIGCCLEKDPTRRLASAAEFARIYAGAGAVRPTASRRAAPATVQVPPLSAPAAPLPRHGSNTTLGAAAGEVAGRQVAPRSALWWIIPVAVGVLGLLAAGGILVLRAVNAPEEKAAGTRVAARAKPKPAARAKPKPAPKPAPKSAPKPAPKPAPTSAPKPAPTSAPKPAAQPTTHTIVVNAKDPKAVCRLQIQGRAPQTAASPCRLVVPHAAKVNLEVARPGFEPFVSSWTVKGDHKMTIRLVKQAR